MLDLLLVILFAIAGTALGCLTGLIPGFHVNNIAFMMLSLSSVLLSFLSPLGKDFALLLLSLIIIAMSISHTFLNIVPATFVGVPEEETALTLLPAHSMLLKGKGYEAVSWSALGSLGAVIVCFLFLLPFRFILGSPINFYPVLKEVMVWILIAISMVLIGTEKKILLALCLFILSGIFGSVIFDMNTNSPIGMPTSVLFPALAGLFGMATLINSFYTKPQISEQIIREPKLDEIRKPATSIGVGALAGSLVSILPGVTAAVATIIAMVARGEKDERQTIITLSAVNTATAFFVIIALFIILHPRSGAAIAVNELLVIEEWNCLLLPSFLCYFLIAIIISGVISYSVTKYFGKVAARNLSKIPYQLLIKIAIGFIIAMVFIFTGFIGLLVLGVGTAIGLIPINWGIKRSICMGVLLLPIILNYLM